MLSRLDDYVMIDTFSSYTLTLILAFKFVAHFTRETFEDNNYYINIFSSTVLLTCCWPEKQGAYTSHAKSAQEKQRAYTSHANNAQSLLHAETAPANAA